MVLQDIFNKIKLTCGDILIMLFVALAAVVLFVAGADGGTPTVCVIEINGEEFASYDLLSFTDRKVIDIDNQYGKNTIVIDNGGVEIIYSDCADRLEVKSGRITEAGQCLICLPHRLTVRLDGDDESDGTSW